MDAQHRSRFSHLFNCRGRQKPAQPGRHRTAGEFCEAGSATPDYHGGRALGPGGLGERLGWSLPLDLGVGSPQIGCQLPVPVHIPGWRVR